MQSCTLGASTTATVAPVQGDLQRMFEVFEFMKVNGRRPGPETCYILVKGCVDQGRPDLAEIVIREFEQNQVR